MAYLFATYSAPMTVLWLKMLSTYSKQRKILLAHGIEHLIVGSVFKEMIEGSSLENLMKYLRSISKTSASMSDTAMTSLVSGKLPKKHCGKHRTPTG